MINHQYKCIFVHIIKTGGVSIATAMGMEKRQFHLTSSQIRARLGEDIWGSYFKFSFVRNPWDKMVSQYHYNHAKWVPESTSFKEYIELWNSGQRISKKDPLQLPYLSEEMDFIGRFENLQSDFDQVCIQIGMPKQQLPHSNKSKHRHYTEYYDSKTRDIVAAKCARDIEYFGYEFGK